MVAGTKVASVEMVRNGRILDISEGKTRQCPNETEMFTRERRETRLTQDFYPNQ